MPHEQSNSCDHSQQQQPHLLLFPETYPPSSAKLHRQGHLQHLLHPLLLPTRTSRLAYPSSFLGVVEHTGAGQQEAPYKVTKTDPPPFLKLCRRRSSWNNHLPSIRAVCLARREMSADDSPLWLGLDLSTQSLTLVVLPDAPGAELVYNDSVQFMTDLPQFMTEHGMHVSDGDHGEKVGAWNSCRVQSESIADGRAVAVIGNLAAFFVRK